MSQSKSLKADKELMWKKLSTVQRPPDWPWKDMLTRSLAGWKKGEITIIASGRRTGKSTMMKEFVKHLPEIDSNDLP